MSMTEWLLDTSILVDMLRGNKHARDWIDSLPNASRFISVIVAAELLAGCRNRAEQRAIERELSLYIIVWLDEDISQTALEFYQRYHLSHGISFLDCLLAATSLKRGLYLATLNVKHFAPVSGIQADKPY